MLIDMYLTYYFAKIWIKFKDTCMKNCLKEKIKKRSKFTFSYFSFKKFILPNNILKSYNS